MKLNIKKSSIVFLSVAGLFNSTAFSMDMSGIDVQTIRIATRAPGELKTTAISDARFKRECPQRFGAQYEFSGYTAEQKSRTPNDNEVTYAIALKNQIIEDINKNPNDPSLKARIEAYDRLVASLTLTETTYALCASFGPSTKPKRQQDWDRLRVNIEMFLMRHGYYNIKLKILSFLGL